MVFTTVDELQQTALLDRLAAAPGFGRERLLFSLKILEARALDTTGDTAEAELDDLVGQTNSLKQLRPTIGGDGRDAHLGDDLHQPLGDALAIVFEHFIEIAQHFTSADQIAQHLESKERIDRSRAETDQHRKVMRVTGRGGFHQDVAAATQAGIH